MGANPQHDEPFGLLDAVGVGLRVSQGFDLDGVGFLDLVGCSVADEDGLASPFDNDLRASHVSVEESVVDKARREEGGGESYVLAFGDCREVDLNLGHGQDVGRGGHVDQEICRRGEGTYRQRSFPPSRTSSQATQYAPSPVVPYPRGREGLVKAHLG